MQPFLEEAYTPVWRELHFLWPFVLPCLPLRGESLSLQTTPVRELSEALIYEYPNAVVNKSDDDYQQHLSARILEMIAHYIEIRVDDSLSGSVSLWKVVGSHRS